MEMDTNIEDYYVNSKIVTFFVVGGIVIFIDKSLIQLCFQNTIKVEYSKILLNTDVEEAGNNCNTFCPSSYNSLNSSFRDLKCWHNVPLFVFYE